MNLSKQPKVVIDTSVFISALLFRKKIGALLDVTVEKCTLCYSHELIIEVEEKLKHKFHVKQEVLENFNKLVSYDTVYKVEIQVDFPADPNDAFLLALSETCGAHYLITSDRKHLLPLKKWKTTKIVSPQEFLSVIT